MKPMAQFTISPELRRSMRDETTHHKVIISIKKGKDIEKIAKGMEQKLKLTGKRALRKTQYYIFAELTKKEIETIAKSVNEVAKIWPDRKISKALDKSAKAIKADAAWRTFDAYGEGITWAVLDTGIDADHPHFTKYSNVLKDLCKDFTGKDDYKDKDSHGTHVAGTIAGASEGYYMKAEGDSEKKTKITASGVAPKAKIVALKVLDDEGNGDESWIIEAMEYIRKVNEKSREMVIHGVNMSLSGQFEVGSYGCGHTPLCDEADRLVMSGVVVCCAAGNDGFNIYATLSGPDEVAPVAHYSTMTIGDPGNAEHVITVGSTHKENPHTYGITYFSAKGPTGDGRPKPDLVAPGEKIVSALSRLSEEGKKMKAKDVSFTTMSGTSQATPHVSGAVAAFLCVKSEFIGRPLDVKKILMDACTDLNREKYVQGRGLVDVFRAVQSV
jgi:subtilisin family serine protease